MFACRVTRARIVAATLERRRDEALFNERRNYWHINSYCGLHTW